MRNRTTRTENADLAGKLREMADLLAAQQADGFRIAANRRAAAKLEEIDQPVSEILAEVGPEALLSLIHISETTRLQ